MYSASATSDAQASKLEEVTGRMAAMQTVVHRTMLLTWSSSVVSSSTVSDVDESQELSA